MVVAQRVPKAPKGSPADCVELEVESLAPDEARAIDALSALGQWTRLRIFRLLVSQYPEGLPAGTIADALGCLNNTMSAHLGILARAGLIAGVRDGRSILYRADLEGMKGLVGYLLTDCCDGHPEVCAPIFQALKCGCEPTDECDGETSNG